jgi:MFS family permease
MPRWAAVRALRSRNYRLFFGGQSISLIGTWMTRIATSWLVYRLTNSALLLGVAGFASQVPSFFIAPLAGVLIDRWDRRRTLVVTQILAMIQSFALAALALSNHINIWWIISLALVQGLINSFDMPARQAFVIEMIDDRSYLSNAIALNSSMVNGSRLLGPAIAGIVIAKVGEGYCFLIDGISYIAVIISLLMMRVALREHRQRTHPLHDLMDGWKYVSQSPAIRSILTLLGLVNMVGMPYSVLAPIIAGTVLHGDANTLGLLMGASGVGALISAISLTLRTTVIGLGRMIAISSALFGVGLILFGASRSLPLSMLLMAVTGFGMMQQMAASNTILQTIISDTKRGRVMAFYTLAVVGVTPWGSLMAGSLAQRIGAPATLAFSGTICLGASIWFWLHLPALRRVIRPIYVELGIVKEPALQIPPES